VEALSIPEFPTTEWHGSFVQLLESLHKVNRTTRDGSQTSAEIADRYVSVGVQKRQKLHTEEKKNNAQKM
jgi:hypothetical protein